MLEPKEGLLTFRAEGNNTPGSIHYSRVIHWPGNTSGCKKNASGVTIGRGFDLGNRSKDEAMAYLKRAGISREKALKIAEGKQLTHCLADEFVRANKEKIKEITESEQLRLFEIVYVDYVYDSIRFYNKYKSHRAILWEKLDQRLKDVFVDMKYQGRLTKTMVKCFEGNARHDVIKLIRSNAGLMDDERNRSRIRYLEGEIQ